MSHGTTILSSKFLRLRSQELRSKRHSSTSKQLRLEAGRDFSLKRAFIKWGLSQQGLSQVLSATERTAT